jgi:hypothetical protein
MTVIVTEAIADENLCIPIEVLHAIPVKTLQYKYCNRPWTVLQKRCPPTPNKIKQILMTTRSAVSAPVELEEPIYTSVLLPTVIRQFTSCAISTVLLRSMTT